MPGTYGKSMSIYGDDEGEIAVRAARAVIESHIRGEPEPEINFPPSFDSPAGAFTTINTYPEHMLRGCIGYPGPYFPLKESIVRSAKEATNDPRFYPLGEDELERIVVEVSILTPPRLMEVRNPREYLKKIKIGRDGLIVQNGFKRGLLLPQVPVDERWDSGTFLNYTCVKAGLPSGCWKDKKTKVFVFTGEVFEELSPRGDVERKIL